MARTGSAFTALAALLALSVTAVRGSEHQTPEQLERLWAALASEDAVQAHQAARGLAATPHETLRLLRQRLRTVPAPTAEHLARLLADLDSARYAVRLKAMQELQELGDLAAPALRDTLARRPSLEVCRRVEALLQKMERPALTTDQLRALRAVQVLERINTPEARDLLRALAAGAPSVPLTQDARGALERLEQRAAAP
jgi:hypothetical protein